MTVSKAPELSQMNIPCVSNDGSGASIFSVCEYHLSGSTERMLTKQLAARNFRLRTSDQFYASGWHVAGDPTLLVVLSGTVKIELRSGEAQEFSPGQLFIAQDYLKEGVLHDDSFHGHRAEATGGIPISLLHLKLDSRQKLL